MLLKRKGEGTICVFLALVVLLIMSLILGFLESARRSASESYAQMLLKTATESVMGDFCGPLFADYHIFAIDGGFGSKTCDTDELERKIKYYMGENVWDFTNTEVRVLSQKKLMDSSGDMFMQQLAGYEKYAAAGDIIDEVLDRIKNLSSQKTVLKVMEKKLGIENELSVIDKCTSELMTMIDGVKLTLGKKGSSLLGFSVEDEFIKRFYVGTLTMSGAMINNPSVFESVKEKYEDPVRNVKAYVYLLTEYRKKLEETEKDRKELEEKEKEKEKYEETLKIYQNRLEEVVKEAESSRKAVENYKKKIESLSNSKKKNKQEEIDRYKQLILSAETKIAALDTEKVQLETDISTIVPYIEACAKRIAELEKLLEKAKREMEEKLDKAEDLAEKVEDLHETTLDLLEDVIDIVDSTAEKQAKVRPMVEEYEKLLITFGPVLSDEVKESLNESLDYMKAYVGMGSGRIKTTDFASIKRTAEYDANLLNSCDLDAFSSVKKESMEDVNDKISKAERIIELYSSFSYSGFYFDYSDIKTSTIENKLVEEFEKNVSEGYLGLFFPSGTKFSDNSMISELLPSKWYEVFKNSVQEMGNLARDADEKGGGEVLDDADEGAGLSSLGDLIDSGVSKIGNKLLTSMYMLHHFKNYRDRSVTGDTVLDYEVEYILSGFETDKANLSAAVTKIMLMRLIVCTIYTMTDKDLKSQAQILATSILGFLGFPFLVAIVKYLILFLWAAAQAVIETAAIVRGKKVPALTNDESFCLTLAELPFFATLVSQKADNFAESEAYLDYGNYLLILLLLQGQETQAARTMDVIQENIRYKYDEDFLMSNAITSFSCAAEFSAPAKYSSLLSNILDIGSQYKVLVYDTVSF